MVGVKATRRLAVWALVTLLLGACASTRHHAPVKRAEDVLPIVTVAAARYGISSALILGVIEIESSFRADAVSSVGARGLMQLMPATAEEIAGAIRWGDYDIHDPNFNINAGSAYPRAAHYAF